eukprot:CAMPEP_0184494076 /NCGR_PEP_ID=MMETSP0113_2-20130426/27716_1 /TAXON_ID=91329 /ORGANISM="Norrisiella sphaerica, Strain BC52" /LENGTH=158 /DNA_ID=CAMNT_0026879641 /DNA_START=152 /DNA_END=628 /DNA_ORIENTATION=-
MRTTHPRLRKLPHVDIADSYARGADKVAKMTNAKVWEVACNWFLEDIETLLMESSREIVVEAACSKHQRSKIDELARKYSYEVIYITLYANKDELIRRIEADKKLDDELDANRNYARLRWVKEAANPLPPPSEKWEAVLGPIRSMRKRRVGKSSSSNK